MEKEGHHQKNVVNDTFLYEFDIAIRRNGMLIGLKSGDRKSDRCNAYYHDKRLTAS